MVCRREQGHEGETAWIILCIVTCELVIQWEERRERVGGGGWRTFV